jgi:hypothetical protein
MTLLRQEGVLDHLERAANGKMIGAHTALDAKERE